VDSHAHTFPISASKTEIFGLRRKNSAQKFVPNVECLSVSSPRTRHSYICVIFSLRCGFLDDTGVSGLADADEADADAGAGEDKHGSTLSDFFLMATMLIPVGVDREEGGNDVDMTLMTDRRARSNPSFPFSFLVSFFRYFLICCCLCSD
jgi:hypothetical protein